MKILKLVAAALAATLVLCVGTLFAMSRRTDAGRNAGAIEINRPPEQVFAYLTEPDKLKAWVTWLVEVRTNGDGLGARNTWVMEDANNNNQRMEMHAVVAEWDPPRLLTVELSSPIGFTGRHTYKLTALPGGRTRLDSDGRYQYGPWYYQLLEPLITPSAQKKFDGDLARLKATVEKN